MLVGGMPTPTDLGDGQGPALVLELDADIPAGGAAEVESGGSSGGTGLAFGADSRAGPGSGQVLSGDGVVGDDHPEITEAGAETAIGTVIDLNVADRGRSTEIDLPPGFLGVHGGMGDGVVDVVAVDVAVDGPGRVAVVVGGDLGGRLVQGQVARTNRLGDQLGTQVLVRQRVAVLQVDQLHRPGGDIESGQVEVDPPVTPDREWNSFALGRLRPDHRVVQIRHRQEILVPGRPLEQEHVHRGVLEGGRRETARPDRSTASAVDRRTVGLHPLTDLGQPVALWFVHLARRLGPHVEQQVPVTGRRRDQRLDDRLQ
jgi:hypothetical protein